MRLETLIWLIPLPPLAAFAVIALFTSRKRALSHALAIGAAALSWVASMMIVYQCNQCLDFAENPLHSQIAWFETGESDLSSWCSGRPFDGFGFVLCCLDCLDDFHLQHRIS